MNIYIRDSFLELGIPDNIKEHILELNNIASSIELENKNKEIAAALNGNSIQQIVSAYFELDMYMLFKDANLNPGFISSIQSHTKIADLTVTLPDNHKIIVECTVISEPFKGILEKDLGKILRAYNILDRLIKKSAIYPFGTRIKDIKVEGKISSSCECNIINFFSKLNFNLQSSEREIEYFRESKSISFTVEKDPRNPNGYTFPSLQLKDPIEQILRSLNEKKRKFVNNKEPSIIAIMPWGTKLWFNENSVKRLKELQIGSISKKISGILIFPSNSEFFPFSDTKHITENHINKQVVTHAWFIDGYGFRTWCKEKRYSYFIRNPNALYPLSRGFEGNLKEVIKVIELTPG